MKQGGKFALTNNCSIRGLRTFLFYDLKVKFLEKYIQK